MRQIGVAERRARLARRHRLAPEARADDPVQVARSMVALHGTDPSTVYLSVWARMTAGDVASVERALYQDRQLVRLLGMRRTVFVVPLDNAPLVQAACARDIAARERRKLVAMLTEAGVAEDSEAAEAWLRDVEATALRALGSRGEATAAELRTDDARLATELVLARGKSYEGRQSVCSRVLFLLAADGRVVRGRPLGSWTSSQFRWSPRERWCPDGAAGWAAEDAEVELARRWLAAFGPATMADLRWWTGWTATQTKRALRGVAPVEVDLDGTRGLVLADDADPVPAVQPWVALLPALDPTPMGWTQRQWFLGEHGPQLFDQSGNVSPTVWWDGRVVGGWAQRKNGEVVYRFLEDIGADATAAVESAAAALGGRLGEVRLTPRTRGASAVERELMS
ncbi:MAG: winged helix DNA-binding domain-containing protein [Pseudonocardiaceae bacterium]